MEKKKSWEPTFDSKESLVERTVYPLVEPEVKREIKEIPKVHIEEDFKNMVEIKKKLSAVQEVLRIYSSGDMRGMTIDLTKQIEMLEEVKKLL